MTLIYRIVDVLKHTCIHTLTGMTALHPAIAFLQSAYNKHPMPICVLVPVHHLGWPQHPKNLQSRKASLWEPHHFSSTPPALRVGEGPLTVSSDSANTLVAWNLSPGLHPATTLSCCPISPVRGPRTALRMTSPPMT